MTLPVVERLALVQSALALQQERRGMLTDSDILNAIEDWEEGACTQACVSDECCDLQRLGTLVWAWIEALIELHDR